MISMTPLTPTATAHHKAVSGASCESPSAAALARSSHSNDDSGSSSSSGGVVRHESIAISSASQPTSPQLMPAMSPLGVMTPFLLERTDSGSFIALSDVTVGSMDEDARLRRRGSAHEWRLDLQTMDQELLKHSSVQ